MSLADWLSAVLAASVPGVVLAGRANTPRYRGGKRMAASPVSPAAAGGPGGGTAGRLNIP